MKGTPAILLLVACALIVVSSFMPWIQFRPQVPAGFDMQGADEFMRQAMTATGWRGDVSLFGVTVPNWFVPVMAIAIGAMTLMRKADMWDAPPALSTGFAAYCTAHLGVLIVVVVLVGPQARVGLGAPLGLLASLGALGVTVFGRSSRDDEYVPSPRTSYHSHEAPRQAPMPDDMPDDMPAPPDFRPSPRERV